MSLTSFDCEISNGAGWTSLNDGLKYRVSAEGTKDNTQTSWRKIEAKSPVLEGSYLVHAVKDEVMDNLTVYVYGGTHTELNQNLQALVDLFSQFSFQIRFTYNGGGRETWDCHVADHSISRNQVYTHANMAVFSASVPRMPEPTYG